MCFMTVMPESRSGTCLTYMIETFCEKSLDWFLYDMDLRHERVKSFWLKFADCFLNKFPSYIFLKKY